MRFKYSLKPEEVVSESTKKGTDENVPLIAATNDIQEPAGKYIINITCTVYGCALRDTHKRKKEGKNLT